MAKSKSSGASYGFGRILDIILAIIPITNIILGIVKRVQKGKILVAILNVILAPIFYIIDLITVILTGKLILGM